MRAITLNYKGVKLDVDYSIEPAEKQTLSDPGCPEHIIIENILLNGEEVNELLEDQWEDIEEAIMNELSK